jgi:hypothetical protein
MQVFSGSKPREKYPYGGHRYSGHCSKPGEKYPQDTCIPVTAANPGRSICRIQVFRSLQQSLGEVSTGHRYSGHCNKPGVSIHHRTKVFRSLQPNRGGVPTGPRYSGHCSKPQEEYPQDTGIPVTAANPWEIPTGFRYFPVTAADHMRSIHQT